MSTFAVTIQSRVYTVETLTNDDVPANSTVTHSQYDVLTNLSASTTPNVDTAAFETFTLSSGSATIDLTALTLNGAAVSLSAKQPRALHIKNTGSNSMTIAKGASNGYTGLGSSFSITLAAGAGVLIDWPNDNSTAVSGSVKTLDVTGTGTDTLQLSVVAGT